MNGKYYYSRTRNGSTHERILSLVNEITGDSLGALGDFLSKAIPRWSGKQFVFGREGLL